MEYFVHLPDPDKWIPADQKDQPMAKFIRSVHLEKIHVAGGGISFAGDATRAHGAILGDTSAGSFFDIAGSQRHDIPDATNRWHRSVFQHFQI